jgi:serine/threonine protein kinase
MAQPPPPSPQGYTIIRRLGGGSYGTVYLAQAHADQAYVAIKAIHKATVKTDGVEHARREAKIMAQLAHRNICNFYETQETNDYFLIIMEYAPRGDLLEYIERKGRVSEQQARIWFTQMCHALQHAHKRFYVHRDIKLEVLLR